MLVGDSTISSNRNRKPQGDGCFPRGRHSPWSMGSRGERSLPGRDPTAKEWRNPIRAGLALRGRQGSKGQARPLAMGCRGARRLLTGDSTARRWSGGMQRGREAGPLAKIAVLHRTSCDFCYSRFRGLVWRSPISLLGLP